MPWVKLDEQFTEHPKILKAGPLGLVLQVRGLCYCNRNLTDGFIPKSQVEMWASDLKQVATHLVGPQYTFASKQNGSDLAAELGSYMVNFGLWEDAEGGYQIHSYLVYQPSKHSLQRLTAIRKQVGRAGGVASGQAKRKQHESNLLKNPVAKGQAKSNPEPETETLTTTTGVLVGSRSSPSLPSSDLLDDSQGGEPLDDYQPPPEPAEAPQTRSKREKQSDACETCMTCLSVTDEFNTLLREAGLLGSPRGHRAVGEGGRLLHKRHEAYSVEECLIVVRKMVPEWQGTDFQKHLTLETLFRPGNFDKYLNRLVKRKRGDEDDLPLPGTPEFDQAARRGGL